MRRFFSISLLAGLLLTAIPASAVPVTLELLLLVDVSGSVDGAEYDLQRGGYVAAFQNATIQSLIANTPGGIAVAYAEWSSSNEQSLQVAWTQLTDAASATAFAAAINATIRPFGGLTAPGSAINFGVPLFANGFEGTRNAIDISGDGSQNDGADTFDAATAAAAAGITVNGLPILTDQPDLDVFYQDNIVTPGGGFLTVATNFDTFEDAVIRKIATEIRPVPEPSSLALLGLGTGALVLLRRRFSRS